MADFGWSASCLVEAIKLTNTARKALKDAGGATSQYEDAASFLTSLKSTLDLLKQHLDKLPNESHVTAIKNHLREIDAPWADFKSTLEKYEKSLSAESTKSKTKQAPRKIQWAAKGVDEAVRKLRERVMQPIQAINCALTLSILESLNKPTQTLWTETQCKQLLDAIHIAAIPRNLSRDLSVLKAESSQNGLRNAEQLESSKELKDSLLRIETMLAAKMTGGNTENTSKTSQNSESVLEKSDVDDILKEQHFVLDTVLAEIQRLSGRATTQQERKSIPTLSVLHILSFSLGAFLASYRTGTSRRWDDARREEALPRPTKMGEFEYTQNPASASRGLDVKGYPVSENRSQANTVRPQKQQSNETLWHPTSEQFRLCPYNDDNCYLAYPPLSITDHNLESHIWDCHREAQNRECPVLQCSKTFLHKDNERRHLKLEHRQQIPDREAGSRLTPDLTYVDPSMLKERPPPSKPTPQQSQNLSPQKATNSQERRSWLIRNPGHVSSPPPLPADTWYCNDCGALVLNAVSPEKCPVCGACKL